MAKKKEKQIPWKQQVYESMLTSQLYGDQPTQEEKIQKSYDEWKANKDTTARIQERYDAWLAEKNKTKEPQEPSQPIEATTTPKAETKTEKKKVKAPVKKENEIYKTHADVLAGLKRVPETKQETKEKEQKRYLTHKDVMPKLTKRSNEAKSISRIAKQLGISEDEVKQRMTAPKEELNSYDAKKIDKEATAQLQARASEDARKRAQKKYNPWEAFTGRFAKATTDIVNAPVAIAGKLAGKDWSIYNDAIKQEFKDAKEQHPVASTLGDLSGMAFAAYALGGGSVGTKATEGTANAGQVFNALKDEALLNGASKKVATAQALKGAFPTLAANAASNMPTDFAVDVIPTLANDIAEGEKTKGEIIRDTLLNTGINYGFNTIGDAISLGRAMKNIPDPASGGTAFKTLDADEIAQLNTNPLEADNKQFTKLMNEFNGKFKDESAMKNIFTPEDLDASQNNQLAALMDEYRAKSAVDELTQNIDEPIKQATIPELRKPTEPFVRQDLNARNSFVREDLNRRLPTMNEDIDTLNPILGERAPFTREAIGETAEAINPTPSTLDLPDEVWDKLDSRFVEIAEPLNKVERSGIMESVTDEKALKEWAAVNEAYSDYLDKAMFSGSIDEANAAKKTLDAARKRYSRAMKDIDPEISREFNSGSFGNQIGRPIYDRNVKAVEDSSQETADLINELENSVPENAPSTKGSWLDNLEPVPRENIDTSGPRPYAINQEEKPLIKNTAEEINRWAEENGLVDEEEDLIEQAIDNVTQKKVPGANKLQFFGKDGNNGTWKIGKWRINTAEKTGRIKNPDDVPIRNYAYRVFTEEEQNQVAKERYKASKDIAADLMRQDRFDEVDIKAAMNEWQRFMDSNDTKALKRANLLSYKIDKEVRDAGRVDQALQEFTRNTPAGQVRVAQQAIDDVVDKYRGKGTSEALDNIVSKLYKAYEDSNGDKDLFAKKAEEILSGTLRQHVGGKKAIKMSTKAIHGKNYILDMISKGASMEDIAEQVYKKNGGVKLTIEEQKKVYDYLKEAARYPKDSREQEELLSKAAKIVTARSPATWGQMARSFLYNNMLGNFKTALSRNAFGNLGYQTLEQARQPIAAGVDYLTSKVTGKHSTLGWNKEKAVAYAKGFKKGLKDQVLDMAKHIDTGRSGQMGWEIALKNNATTFNDTKPIGKFLNGVEYYVRNAMELGDRPFYESVYNQSYTELMQLLDRYGKDGVAGLEGIKDEDIPAMVDIISSVRASDSVFQKHGKMSKGLTDIRNGLGEMSQGILGTDILSTAAGAFTMTPGNMIERAIEYTPLGFVKNAVETGTEVLGKKGFNQRRFVDEASRSIAGLPILGATYAMSKNGMINGGYSTDPDEKAAQQEDGFIEYGFNVPEEVPYYGGKTWDTSDIPVVGPFMQAGSVIAEEGITPKAGMQAAEAVLGSSATQGFRRAFGADTASYSSQNSMVDNLANTVLSSGSQLVPSLLRQTAQTIDPYKRDLGEYGTPEYYVNLMKNNIPGVRQTLPVKTNVEGEKVLQNQGRGLGAKILENYVLPMNVSEYKPSPLNTEASRLKQATGENSGFAPKAKRSDLRNWDEADHSRYSEEQFRRYKEDLGKLNASAGNALTDSKFYKGLSDEDKVKYLGDMYKTMKKVARKNATGHLDKEDKALNTYLNAGGGKKGTQALIDYYQHKHIFGKYDVSESDGANALYEKYGEKGVKNYSRVKKALRGSEKRDDIKSAINSTLPTLSKSEKALYYTYFESDVSPGGNPFGYVAGVNYKPEKDTTYQKAKGVIPNLTPEKFYETRDAIDKWGDESRGKSYGNNIISEDEMIPYLNANAKNLAEAQSIYAAYGNPGTNKKGVTKHVVQKGGKYDLSY